MPNSSRDKGARAERYIVETFRAVGLEAYRIRLSGASSGFKNDVELRLGNRTLRLESKARSQRMALIYKWLQGSDALVIKADRKPALLVMNLEEFAILLGQNQSQTEKPASEPLAQ